MNTKLKTSFVCVQILETGVERTFANVSTTQQRWQMNNLISLNADSQYI